MIAAIDRWMFAEGSPRRLAFLRIGLCSVLAVRLTRTIYTQLAGQPEALFRPLSFMNLFDRMPPAGVVIALQTIGVAAAVAGAIGWKTRWSIRVAWGCALVLIGMTTSVGKVVHNDVLLLLAMVPLLAARSGDAWSIDSRRVGGRLVGGDYGWPVRCAMVVVALAYFLTGYQKLATSGVSWISADNIRFVMLGTDPNAVARLIADTASLAFAIALFTIVVEIGFPLALWRPRLAWFFVPGALALHAGIFVAMGLDYWPQMATVLIVFAAAPPRPLPKAATTIEVRFDADCGFCRWALGKIVAWDRRAALRPVPFESPGAEAWEAVVDDRTYRGGAAATRIARALPLGMPLYLAGRMLPGLAERLYRFVANRRDRLGARLGADACSIDPAGSRA